MPRVEHRCEVKGSIRTHGGERSALPYDKLRLYFLQDVLLRVDVLLLIGVHYVLLLNALQSKGGVFVLQLHLKNRSSVRRKPKDDDNHFLQLGGEPHQLHSSKSPTAQSCHDLQLLERLVLRQ